MNTQLQPTIAMLPWGDLWEDFLDSIGVSFTAFCNEMNSGWLFGYIEALKLVGVRTVLFCISARVDAPTYYTHKPTDTKICVLPATQLYQKNRSQIPNPYGFNLKEAIGDVGSIRRYRLKIIRNILPYLATPLRLLANELRAENCQAILCQEYEYARFDACVFLGKLMGLPVFPTFQGGNFQISRLEKYFRPITIKACAGIIAATQTEIQRIQTSYNIPSNKIARIFNPINLENWQGIDRIEARKALNIPVDARVVVCHGRIDMHRKGLDILTDAWQQIHSDRPHKNLRLLLVGTGSDADKLQQRITSMQLKDIIWLNEYVRDRTLITQYLSAADVYTLPSRHEGFPVAPLEAMACSLPVVAADAPGVPDIFANGADDGGLVVPRENPQALAAALGKILDHPDLSCQLGDRALHRVQENFSPLAIGKQLKELLLK